MVKLMSMNVVTTGHEASLGEERRAMDKLEVGIIGDLMKGDRLYFRDLLEESRRKKKKKMTMTMTRHHQERK